MKLRAGFHKLRAGPTLAKEMHLDLDCLRDPSSY